MLHVCVCVDHYQEWFRGMKHMSSVWGYGRLPTNAMHYVTRHTMHCTMHFGQMEEQLKGDQKMGGVASGKTPAPPPPPVSFSQMGHDITVAFWGHSMPIQLNKIDYIFIYSVSTYNYLYIKHLGKTLIELA